MWYNSFKEAALKKTKEDEGLKELKIVSEDCSLLISQFFEQLKSRELVKEVKNDQYYLIKPYSNSSKQLLSIRVGNDSHSLSVRKHRLCSGITLRVTNKSNLQEIYEKILEIYKTEINPWMSSFGMIDWYQQQTDGKYFLCDDYALNYPSHGKTIMIENVNYVVIDWAKDKTILLKKESYYKNLWIRDLEKEIGHKISPKPESFKLINTINL